MKIAWFRKKIEDVLLVCKGEWAYLLWMALLNFLLSAGAVLAFSVINALMMVRFGFKPLPTAFIISAVVLTPYFSFYNHMEKKVSRKNILILSFVAYSLLIAFCRYMLGMSPDDYYLLLITYVLATCILLLVDFQYWSFANYIFHPRQGKRLFPLLGMGGNLGAIFMGFSLEKLTMVLGGSSNLFYLWSVIFFLSAAVVFTIYQKLKIRKKTLTRASDNFIQSTAEDFKIIVKLPILKVIAIIIFIMSIVSFIIYFQFYRVVGEYFPAEDNFTGFVGYFNGILNLSILFFQLFITGRLVSGLGVIRSMFFHPVLLFIPVMASALLAKSGPIVASRFIDLLNRKTFFQTASEAIYGSVPDEMREQAMSFMKIIIAPLSIGITGISLFAMIKAYPEAAPVVINTILPFLFVFWLLSLWHLKEHYITTLFENFTSKDSERKLESFIALSHLTGSETVSLLRRILEKGSDPMKRFAIELVGEMKMEVLTDEVVEFLKSENEELVIEAIRALGSIGSRSLFPQLMKMYKGKSAKLKIEILKSLKSLDVNNFHINCPLLVVEEEDEVVQGFLMENISSKQQLLTEQKDILKKLCSSDKPEARISAAITIRNARERSFTWEIVSLIKDEDDRVKKEAAITAGCLGLEEAIKPLIDLLGYHRRDLALVSEEALLRIKGTVFQVIKQGINLEQHQFLLEQKLRILGQSPNEEDQEFLLEISQQAAPESTAPALYKMARSISQMRKFSQRETRLINDLIDFQIKKIQEELAAAYSLKEYEKGEEKAYQLLLMLLGDKTEARKKIIVLSLHFLYPHEKILTLYDQIFDEREHIYGRTGLVGEDQPGFSASFRKRHIALEALENILPIQMKNKVMQLFEKDDLEEEIQVISSNYPGRIPEIKDCIDYFINSDDRWLKSWAVYSAGLLKVKDLKESVESFLEDADPLLAEHAKFGLSLMEETG